MVKPTINSEKHIRQNTIFTVAASAVSTIMAAAGVAIQDKDASNEVREGCEIKAIWIEYWITSDGADQASVILTLEKLPAAASAMTYAQSVALNDYPNKKNILYTTMGLAANNTSVPIPFVRQFVRIPKGKQRMGLGDKLNITISSPSGGVNVCGIAIYKEYF